MTNTKQRHIEILSAAITILNENGGVATINNLPQDERLTLLRQMAKDVKITTSCHIDTAKRNIAKAMRKERYQIMVENWGGPRPGSGRPKN